MYTGLFTRGGPDLPDDRGASMIQRHTERLQKEKEAAALSAIREELPEVSPAVLALALQETKWEVAAAVQLVKIFLNVRGPQLTELQKELHHSKRRHPVEDHSTDSDESEMGGKRDRSDKKSKAKKKRKHAEKRKHSDKLAKKELASTDRFGRYGIIRESDADRMRSEFVMWATEAKGIDVEILPKWEEKELFRTFCEDHNTGTLPHKKYYDLAAYEKRRALKAAKKGKTAESEKANFNDEAEVAAARRTQALVEQQERLREAYNELKYTAPDKVEAMRDQEMTRMQMNLAYRTGDREKAEMLANKLKPDEPIWKDGVLVPLKP